MAGPFSRPDGMPPGMRMRPAELAGEAFAAAERLTERLDAVAQAMERQEEERIKRELIMRSGAEEADGTGVARIDLKVPMGAEWILKRIATTAGAGGALAVYLDAVDPAALVDYDAAPQVASRDLGEGIPVAGGRTIIFRFFTQPAAQLCTFNLSIRELARGA